jgi:hypothetical protein
MYASGEGHGVYGRADAAGLTRVRTSGPKTGGPGERVYEEGIRRLQQAGAAGANSMAYLPLCEKRSLLKALKMISICSSKSARLASWSRRVALALLFIGLAVVELLAFVI